MAFDLKQYVKDNKSDGFDLKAYVQDAKKSANVPEEKSGALQAAVEHYGNAATMGYLPHVQAVVEKVLPNPNAKLDAELKAKGFSLPDEKTYIENRDENIKRMAQQKIDHPTASTVGDLAGIAGGAVITGGTTRFGSLLGKLGLGEALPTVAGRVGQAAKTGALMGAVANPGDTEGEASPVQLDSRIKNAAIGGAIGAGTQGAIEGVAKGGKGLADYFRAKAGEKATGAIGANKKAMELLGKEGSQKLGQEALDAGIVGPFTTPAGIAKKAADMKESVGEKIGSLIKTADSKGAPKIDGAKLGLDLLDDAEIIAAKTTPGSESMYNNASKYAETLAQKGELSIKEAHDFRRAIDKNINFNRKRMDLKPGEAEVLYKIRDGINNAMNEAVDAFSGQGANALKDANKQYSQLSRIQDMAENRVAMNSSNRTFGLTDTIAATAGMASGGVPWAALAAGVNKFGRTFGKGIQATGFNNASSLASKASTAALASNKSPQAIQALAALTTQQAKGGPTFDPSQFRNILENKDLIEEFKNNPELIQNVDDPLLRVQIRKKIGLNRNPSSVEKSKDDSPMKRRIKTRH